MPKIPKPFKNAKNAETCKNVLVMTDRTSRFPTNKENEGGEGKKEKIASKTGYKPHFFWVIKLCKLRENMFFFGGGGANGLLMFI